MYFFLSLSPSLPPSLPPSLSLITGIQLLTSLGSNKTGSNKTIWDEDAVHFITLFLKFGAMHFIYQINRLTTTKVDSIYLGLLANKAQRICPVAGLERMTTGLAVSALPYRATQVSTIVVHV